MRDKDRGPFGDFGLGRGRGRAGERRRGPERVEGPEGPPPERGWRRGVPEGRGPERGEHRHGHRGGGARGGRGRVQRGDVRTAILLVLADQPMHGYHIMQAMSDRTGGAWRPSPGAVYPTIAQLEDEGLVTTEEEGGRRLVTLTDEGRAYLAERSERLGDPFADFAQGPAGPDLRDPLHELQTAARQIASTGGASQLEAAARVLAQARRSLYLILAGEPERVDPSEDSTEPDSAGTDKDSTEVEPEGVATRDDNE